MATKKDLLVLLLDVGEHMQAYLPLLHRMVFSAMNCKLLSKPNHEVAVVLYGTKETRHELYDPEDPCYEHVAVLRPLQNLGSHLELERFAFAADPPQAAEEAAGEGSDAAAVAALRAHVAAAGLAGGDSAAVAARAARLFGPPGPKADWGDGLVVALDLLARAIAVRFDKGRPEANKLGSVRLVVVSNLLGQSEPFDDDFRGTLVETCTNLKIQLEVACLDHYAPAPPPAAGDDDSLPPPLPADAGSNPLALLPAALAASRRRNLEQLHLLKSELPPAMFRHLRHPTELLCLFRAKEVSFQASNAVFRLTPGPAEEGDAEGAPRALTLNVKLYKKIRKAAVEEWKTIMEAPPAAAGDDDGGGGSGGHAGEPGFVREVEYEDPTTGQKFSREDFVAKGYSYGRQAVPVAKYVEEHGQVLDEEMRKFKEKDFSLLGFVDADRVPHHRLIDEPHAVLGDAPQSAVAIAALALALKETKQAGLVRFLFRKESPQLGLLTPHLSDSADVPHALLLSPLPFAEDIRTYAFSTFRNEAEALDMPRLLAEARGEEPPPPLPVRRFPEPVTTGSTQDGGGSSQLSGLGYALAKAASEAQLRYERLQPEAEQQDAALALVRGLDLGPWPLPGGGRAPCEPQPEALVPESTANPQLHRIYALVTSRALDPQAQLPDPEDDPLAELVLQPHGRYWPAGAREVIRRAEEKLQTKERVDGGPAAKRARREAGAAGGGDGGDGAAEAGGGAAGRPAAAADAGGAPREVLFNPTASGGTSARVSRVGELTAVEDFRAMLAQGRESASDAVLQLQELVRVLVDRSIGDQLYDKALRCVQTLRAGCAATGRGGSFNTFLPDLVDRCKRQERGAFVSLLVAHSVSLITTDEVARHRPAAGAAGGEGSSFEDDGGAVEPRVSRLFLEQHAEAAEAVDEATLPTVVQDEEFDDMD